MTNRFKGAPGESAGAGQGGGLWRDDNNKSETELVPDEYYWTRENDCAPGFGVEDRPVSLAFLFARSPHTDRLQPLTRIQRTNLLLTIGQLLPKSEHLQARRASNPKNESSS